MTLGALVLHGFTSSLDTVSGLAPHLEAAGIPYRMPYLRGHGQTPEALRGVKYRDWYDDAGAALDDVRGEADRAVIVALSMGALPAMALAVERPEAVAGLALVAPFLHSRSPLAPFSGLLARFLRDFPNPPPPPDPTYVCTNYTWFPTASFVEVYKFQREVEGRLGQITQPLLILGSRRDNLAHPRGLRQILESVRSAEKRLEWFGKTGHEMMQGCEREAVYAEIMGFLANRRIAAREAEARA
ncbi:MAG: alpha/beta fold hydrolase [Candidatus Sericytochromatia bacterium]|nr:alpha/beta fold hydrolase [Candidatus Tanganyikabacteria bacterium]